MSTLIRLYAGSADHQELIDAVFLGILGEKLLC